MPALKVSDVARTAALLKKLVKRSDVNKDGALRGSESKSVTPKNARTDPKRAAPGAAIDAMRLFSLRKGSAQLDSIADAVDEVARRVKAADSDGDGVISEAEKKRLSSQAEKRFVDFGEYFHDSTLGDFNLPEQHEASLPRFSWSGTPEQVCTSLLNAFSVRANDNFWPGWGGEGPSRYVLTGDEAKQMVAALEPLFASRQKAVMTELSSRTLASKFGCVSVDAAARAVFTRYAKSLGLPNLEFKSPAAPRIPAS